MTRILVRWADEQNVEVILDDTKGPTGRMTAVTRGPLETVATDVAEALAKQEQARANVSAARAAQKS